MGKLLKNKINKKNEYSNKKEIKRNNGEINIESNFQTSKINNNNRSRSSLSKNFSEKDSENKLKEFNSSGNTFRRSRSNKIRESSQSIKERIELTECTFKPKINDENPEYIKNREKDIFERLYGEFDRMNKKKMYRRLQNDLRESEILSFSPDLSSSSLKNSYYNNCSKQNSKKFFDRLRDV